MKKDILRNYYQGIMDKIQSEVDNINGNFHHNGLKGDGNEKMIRDLIKKFIPKRYGIDTGVVIDKEGNQSKQCDIIIYDNYNYPELLGLSSVKMFPVDIVYAVIEVKTILNKRLALLSIENIKSVRNLNYKKDNFISWSTDSVEHLNKETTMYELNRTSPPIGIVFGYSSSTNFNTTFLNWFKFNNVNESILYPSHICCLDQGLLVINNFKGMNFKDISPYLYPYNEKGDIVSFIDKEHIIENRGKKWCKFNNRLFPYIQVGEKMMIIDQSKILLNFILYLFELLRRKKISPNINFRETYLPEELKNVLFNHENRIVWREEDYPQYSNKK